MKDEIKQLIEIAEGIIRLCKTMPFSDNAWERITGPSGFMGRALMPMGVYKGSGHDEWAVEFGNIGSTNTIEFSTWSQKIKIPTEYFIEPIGDELMKRKVAQYDGVLKHLRQHKAILRKNLQELNEKQLKS